MLEKIEEFSNMGDAYKEKVDLNRFKEKKKTEKKFYFRRVFKTQRSTSKSPNKLRK